jgi:hypothetical protein
MPEEVILDENLRMRYFDVSVKKDECLKESLIWLLSELVGDSSLKLIDEEK